MIVGLSNRLVDYLSHNGVLNEDREIYVHGAGLVISTLIGTILLLIVGAYTGHFIEAVVYEILFSSSRSILGGYHCKSYSHCIACYVGLFILSVFISHLYIFHSVDRIFIEIIGLIIIGTLCPIENVNKTVSTKKRKIFKRYSIIYTIIYLSIMNYLFYIHHFLGNTLVVFFIVINILIIGGKWDYEKHKS